jgi:hypothetical protein
MFTDSSLINMSTNINTNAASFAQQQQQQQQLAQLAPQQATNSQANAMQRPTTSAVTTDKARENYYMTAADPSGMDGQQGQGDPHHREEDRADRVPEREGHRDQRPQDREGRRQGRRVRGHQGRRLSFTDSDEPSPQGESSSRAVHGCDSAAVGRPVRRLGS